MIVVDTGAIIAAYDSRQRHHDEVRAIFSAPPARLLVSPFVLAEVDYLVATRVGAKAAVQVLTEVTTAMEFVTFEATDVRRACKVIETYADLNIGLADASLVVIAARFNTHRLLTLDRRHFGTVRPLQGGAFHLLPE